MEFNVTPEDEVENLKQQIWLVFDKHGMVPVAIDYNEDLDRFNIEIGVEDTDDRFLRDTGEIGSAGPLDKQPDANALSLMEPQIQGESVPDGEINVISATSGPHFRVEIV